MVVCNSERNKYYRKGIVRTKVVGHFLVLILIARRAFAHRYSLGFLQFLDGSLGNRFHMRLLGAYGVFGLYFHLYKEGRNKKR